MSSNTQSQMQERIGRALELGFTEDQIYEEFSKDPNYGKKISKAKEQGFTDQQIFEEIFPKQGEYYLPGRKEALETEFDIVDRLDKPSDKGFMEQAGELMMLSDGDLPYPMHPAQSKSAGKGFASGATLGLSEYVPFMKLTKQEQRDMGSLIETSKLAGSLLPAEALLSIYGKAGQKLLQQVPNAGRIMTAATNLATTGAAGGTYGALEEMFEKGEMPSASTFVEHGATWMAIDAALNTLGLAARFGKNLMNQTAMKGTTKFQELEALAKRLKKQKVNLNDADEVAQAVFKELGEPLEGKAIQRAEAIKPEGEEAVAAAEEALARGEAKITEAEVAMEAPIEAPKGEDVGLRPRDQVEAKTLDGRRVSYQKPKPESPGDLPVYSSGSAAKAVEEHAPLYINKKSFGEAVQGAFNTQKEAAAAVYEPLYKSVEPVAKKTVYSPQKSIDFTIEALEELASLSTKPPGYQQAQTQLENALRDMGYNLDTGAVTGERSVDDLIKLARRIQELGDYNTLEPSVKKVYNKLAKQLKEEAKQALKYDPEAYQNFIKAEEAYADFARKLERESIQNMRGQQATEKIADRLFEATSLKDLKDIMNKEQFAEVERQFLENLSQKKPAEAQKILRETEEYLTPQGAKLAKDLIAEKQLNEFVDTLITKDGSFDLSKASKAMKNPETRKVIEEIGGKEAVEFFSNLEKLNAELEANLVSRAQQESLAQKIVPQKEAAKARKDAISTKTEAGKAKLQRVKEAQEARRKALQEARDNAVKAKKQLEADLKAAKDNAKLKKEAFDKYNAKIREPIERAGRDFEKGKLGTPATARKSEKGARLLEKTRARNQPIRTYIEGAMEFLGVNDTAAKVLLGLVIGPKKALAIPATRIVASLARKPAARRAYMSLLNASSKRNDPKRLIQAFEAFNQVTQDKE